jgi:hypothetical protein
MCSKSAQFDAVHNLVRISGGMFRRKSRLIVRPKTPQRDSLKALGVASFAALGGSVCTGGNRRPPEKADTSKPNIVRELKLLLETSKQSRRSTPLGRTSSSLGI